MGEFVGFRFHPTEQEIISYFLEMKMRGLDFPVHTVAEVDICKFEPYDLPRKYLLLLLFIITRTQSI